MLTVYVRDICLGSRLEKVIPKKYLLCLGFSEELPLTRGVRGELILKGFWIIMLTLTHNVIFSRTFTVPQLHFSSGWRSS